MINTFNECLIMPHGGSIYDMSSLKPFSLLAEKIQLLKYNQNSIFQIQVVYNGYNKTIQPFRYYSCSSILNLHEHNLKECVRYFSHGMKGGSRWICAEKCKRANERSIDVRRRL
jgi:hypothetical protein